MSILDYRIGISDRTSKGILDSGFNLDGSEMSPEQKQEYEQFKIDNNMSSLPFRSNDMAMGMSISDAKPLSETLGITFNNLPQNSPMRDRIDNLEEIGKGADYITYTDQEKADIAAGRKTPQLGELIDFGLSNIGKVDQSADARTIDEESALLDDAFEQQLALATRTGKLGPFEGIIQNLNPQDAVSFITSLLTGGASTALSGVASLADKLGIRRGMQEPRGAVGKGGYGVSRPGNTLTDQTRANRAQFSDFYSNFQGGAQQQMGKRVDDVISRVGSGRRTRSDAQSFVNKYGSEEQKQNFKAAKEQNRRDQLTSQFKSEEGDTGGGKSIVCTAMYQTTGLQDWKKAMKIWYIYQKKYLTEAHQKGYHWLFKPFVKGMHKNKIIKMIGAHVAKHRTQHLKHVMFNSKPSLLGKIYNKILEPICYWVGKK